jgi:SNF2 family DNA or RNA helicase
MNQINIDLTPSGKSINVTGSMSGLRDLEETTTTYATWKERILRLPASRLAYDGLIETWQLHWKNEYEVVVSPSAKELFAKLKKKSAEAKEILKLKAQNAVTVDDYEFGGEFPPWDHQIKCFGLAKGRPAFGFFMEMGTGKSRVIIDEAAYLYENDLIDLCLVIAYPSGVPAQWIEEAVPTHIPERIKYKPWVRRPGKKIPEEIFEPCKELKFYAINVESLQVQSGKDLIEKILKSIPNKRVLLVFDESTTLKNSQSKRSKFAFTLIQYANYRRILTGCPISQGLHDLYSQFKLLDVDIIGATSLTGFRNRYCKMGRIEYREIIGYKNVSELMERVHGYTYRVRKSECMDLPPKVFINVPIELTPEQAKYYKQMKNDLFIALENGEIIDGAMGVARVLRLQQIVCGHLPDIKNEKTVGWTPIKNHRLDRVKHILKSVDGKTIISSRFSADITQMKLMLGDEAVEYSGKVGQSGKEEAKYLFKNDPYVKYLIGQTQAISHGLDMPYANNMISYARDYSFERWKQIQDRIHRGGQTKQCNYYIFLTPNSVDILIDDVLRKKYNFQKKCLDEEYLKKFL